MRYVILFLTLMATNATASIITVLNSGFEERVINTPGDFTLQDIPNWVSIGQTSTFRPSTLQFPGGVPEGLNVAAAGSNLGDGDISQILTEVLEADTIYTLMVDVGQREDFSLTSYMIELIAGGNTLASSSSLNPASGSFLTDTIVFNSGVNPAQLGQNLEIRLFGGQGGQADFDNVRLEAITASPVPAPAAVWLIGSGLIGLIGMKKKTSKASTLSA